MFDEYFDTNYEETMISSKIQKARDDIYAAWSDVNIYHVGRLKEVWKDPLCNEFAEKVLAVNDNINEITNKLDNLKLLWQKYEKKLEEEKLSNK